MNLEDVIDSKYGLQEDEWSLADTRFGEEGQLQVVGWSGRSGGNKFYILKCSKCSQDSELFGDGYFRSVKSHLVNLEQIPCGCSRSTKWTKKQFTVLCERKASLLGHTFLDFSGEWKGNTTKIKMLCKKHGEWDTGTIDTLLSGRGRGCPSCKADILSQINRKPDDIVIMKFFESGAFHPETKFWRSNRLTKAGGTGYWFMSCPECGQEGESLSAHLRYGNRPCACGKQRQTEGYVNGIVDSNGLTLAIKFGIANSSMRRLRDQNWLSPYDINRIVVYKFPDVASCKRAERECKQTLECGVITKEDLPDGYTETTYVYNLDRIIEIYERNGGTLVEHAC